MRGPPNRDATEKNSTATAASGADAVVTLAAEAENFHVIDSIHCSYAAAATGKLTIAFGSGPTIVWEVDISTAGLREFLFPKGLTNAQAKNEQCVITLLDGSQTKYLNVTYR